MLAHDGRSATGIGEEGLRPIVESYLADLATRARLQTVADARRALLRFVREVPDPSCAAIRQWRQQRLTEGVSHKSVNTEVGALRAALGLAVRDGLLASHPLAGLRGLPVGARYQRRCPRALSEDEIRRLLECAALEDRRLGGIPRLPFIRALLETGMRYGEAVQATWLDFDAAQGLLTARAETTKSAKTRALPLAPQLVALIEGLAWECRRVTGVLPGPASRIFLSPTGCPWPAHSSNFRGHLYRLYADAEIPRRDELGRVVNAHTLRHTFATRLARNGVPIQVARRLMGHASTAMLDKTYEHLEVDDLRSAILGLPPLGGGGRISSGPNRWISRPTSAQAQFGFEDAEEEARAERSTGCRSVDRCRLRLLPPLPPNTDEGLDEV